VDVGRVAASDLLNVLNHKSGQVIQGHNC
jgi:hypothetical protein